MRNEECTLNITHYNKEPRRLLLEVLKAAATYSPTTRSTIGAAELNDPVRNGKGWDLSTITTLNRVES